MTLLCLSSRRGVGVFEEASDASGEVALDAALNLSSCLSVGDAAGGVGAGARMRQCVAGLTLRPTLRTCYDRELLTAR